jgi:hypothetical protein
MTRAPDGAPVEERRGSGQGAVRGSAAPSLVTPASCRAGPLVLALVAAAGGVALQIENSGAQDLHGIAVTFRCSASISAAPAALRLSTLLRGTTAAPQAISVRVSPLFLAGDYPGPERCVLPFDVVIPSTRERLSGEFVLCFK